jgi:hypothetical protein
VIRAFAWLSGWVLISISAATLWEFAATGSLRFGSTVTRGGAILLAIALLTVAIFLIDLWTGMWRHARHNYERRVAAKIVAVESLVMGALLALYLWFVSWVLRQSWPHLRGWTASLELDAPARGSPFLPAWLTWGVLLPLCLLLAWTAPSQWRQAAINYTNAFRLLRFKRTVHGVLLMSLLRLRLPRKDFFVQSPVFSWLPPLALCVFLHVTIEQPVLRWVIPAVPLCWLVPMWLDLIVPPTWLFLGKSDFESFAAFDMMRRTWRQHGLTLLDRVGPQGAEFYGAWRQAQRMPAIFFDPSAPRTWSLRTRPQLWEHTVLVLMDFVLVVVVDVRADSDIVRAELSWLAKPGRIEKAWYLVASDEHGAAVHPRDVFIPIRSRIVTERMLLTAEWSRAGLRLQPDTACSGCVPAGKNSIDTEFRQ